MISASFDVQVIADDVLEGNENFTLDIIDSSLPSGITASNPSQAIVVIREDEGE